MEVILLVLYPLFSSTSYTTTAGQLKHFLECGFFTRNLRTSPIPQFVELFPLAHLFLYTLKVDR